VTLRDLDLVVHNGVLLTQDSQRLDADALAVREARIVAVGRASDLLPLAGRGTRRVDLAGRTLVPGFIDAHAHIWKIGHLLTTLADLRGVESMPALQARLREADRRLPPDAWLLGRGYNEARLHERRSPLRADLDAAVDRRPVVITRTCGHIVACNSLALRASGIGRDTDSPAGGEIDRDERGEPTGVLRETALGLVTRRIPQPTHDDYAAMVGAALRHQLSLGITSTTDAGVAPALVETYRALDADGRLPSRVNVMPLQHVDGVDLVPLPEQFESPRLRLDTVKFFADGGLSGATAAISVPYRHADTRGVLRLSEAELTELAGAAFRTGWNVATHAIGDEAIDRVLHVYEALADGRGRLRIEHFGLPDASQLARAARLGVIVVPQTVFIYALGRNFRWYLPDVLLERAYPVRAMLDAGLAVALSSDAPVVEDDNPLLGMQAAVLRRDDEGQLVARDQSISPAEALYGYTMGAARASGDEANRGSLSAGKWADFAVLSASPLEVPPDELTTVRVDQTWVGGELMFEG
jgi:predicted amidohydrolase YtcJ